MFIYQWFYGITGQFYVDNWSELTKHQLLNTIGKLYVYSFKNIWKIQTLDIYEIELSQVNNRLDNWLNIIILKWETVDKSGTRFNHMKWCLPYNLWNGFNNTIVIVGNSVI